MNKSIEAALGAKRNSGFWIAGCTAFFLSVVSYFNLVAVRFFNIHLFHAGDLDGPGWWLYLGLRLPFIVLFVYTVLQSPGRTSVSGQGLKKAEEGRWFDPLLGLRALACFLVLMGHYFTVVFPFSGHVSPYLRIVLMSSPWSGVWIFFTLSGYLMGKGFARGRYTLDEAGSKLFLRNRFFRIAPIYYCGILIVSLYRYTAIFEWRHWWMLLEMFVFDYRGDLPINPIGALWSVSTEVQFYVLVPLLMVVLLRVREKTGAAFPVVPVLLVGAGTAARIGLTHIAGLDSYAYGYAPLITNLDLFLAGMSINLVPPMHLPVALQKNLGAILAFSGIFFYAAISAATFYEVPLHLGNFWAKGPFLCSSFALLFIYLAETRGRIAIGRGWIGKWLLGLQTMGTLTYCLYVFHPEVFIANAALLPKVIPVEVSVEHFPMVMLELVCLASFFYVAVEKPFDAMKEVSGTALEDAP